MTRTDINKSQVTGQSIMGTQLNQVDRCPHCGVAAPTLTRVWYSDGPTKRVDGQPSHYWAAYLCQSCGKLIAAEGMLTSTDFYVPNIYPWTREAHEDIPPIARRFLQQALDTLHAPDAASVMAGSAVDAMLKAKGYNEGSLYSRIDKALADNLLTQGMADWAHSVRLGSNRPRHADAEDPHVSPSEAQQSVDFAESLGNFLFVLTARIERGIEASKMK